VEKIKKGRILETGAVITILLLASLGASITFVCGKPYAVTEKNRQPSATENITEMQGDILIKKTGFNRLYPSIEIPDNQLLNVTATTVGDFFYVNSVLRIRIDTHLLDPGFTYKIGRHLRTFIAITRPEYSFLGKIVGKPVNYNRSDFLSGATTIDVPLKFKSTENYEEFRIRILAVGSIIGAFSLSYPSITYKILDFKCCYVQPPTDTTPPFTSCYLHGNEIYPG